MVVHVEIEGMMDLLNLAGESGEVHQCAMIAQANQVPTVPASITAVLAEDFMSISVQISQVEGDIGQG